MADEIPYVPPKVNGAFRLLQWDNWMADEWFTDEGETFVPPYNSEYATQIPVFDIDLSEMITPENLDYPDLAEEYNEGGSEPTHYIYYVYCEITHLIKIGISTNPIARFSALQSGCPTDLILLCYHGGNQRYEHHLHQSFRPICRRGEWFWPHKRLCEWVAYYATSGVL
ncbi:MAG: GIY-YIG nuclease family protein [Pseudomonadota bacterium]